MSTAHNVLDTSFDQFENSIAKNLFRASRSPAKKLRQERNNIMRSSGSVDTSGKRSTRVRLPADFPVNY